MKSYRLVNPTQGTLVLIEFLPMYACVSIKREEQEIYIFFFFKYFFL